MASEQDLKETDSGHGRTALRALQIAQTAEGQPRWIRWILSGLSLIVAVFVLAGVVYDVATIGKMPDCGDQQTRDTLSDLNKSNKVNASAYNFIRQTSATDTEVRCTANLALLAGGTLEYDYRIYKDGWTMRVEITDMRR